MAGSRDIFSNSLKIEKVNNMGKSHAIIILYIWILFSMYVAIKLYLEKRYYPMSGWLIVIVIFFIIAYFALRTEKVGNKSLMAKVSDIHKTRSITDNNSQDSLVVLFSTRDIVKIAAIEHALQSSGIHFTIINRHISQMLRFLPSAEMKVMILHEDYERSVKILEGLKVQQ